MDYRPNILRLRRSERWDDLRNYTSIQQRSRLNTEQSNCPVTDPNCKLNDYTLFLVGRNQSEQGRKEAH